jgi:hypothetical protein
VVGGESVGVPVSVFFEGFSVRMEAPAVQLDDQAFGDEQGVDLVTGDVGAHHWIGQAVSLAELWESVLPGRAGRPAPDVDELLHMPCAWVAREPFDDIGNRLRLQEPGPPAVVEGARQRLVC